MSMNQVLEQVYLHWKINRNSSTLISCKLQLKISMQEPTELQICSVEKNSLKFGPISNQGSRTKYETLLFVIWQCCLETGFACTIYRLSQHEKVWNLVSFLNTVGFCLRQDDLMKSNIAVVKYRLCSLICIVFIFNCFQCVQKHTLLALHFQHCLI